MKFAARASTLLLGGFLAMTPTWVRAAEQGGGRGGSGWHGSGGHAGHLSVGTLAAQSRAWDTIKPLGPLPIDSVD